MSNITWLKDRIYFNLDKDMLTQQYLKSILTYDPVTGLFTWAKSRGGTLEGSIAGTHDIHGYVQISIDYKLYKAHRLAFLYMEGTFPSNHVDHVNGVPYDNSWKNLRPCTQQQNLRNVKGRGAYYKNVYYTSGGRKKPFNVKIEVDGVPRSFGYYETPEEANAVAIMLRKQFHGEFANN